MRLRDSSTMSKVEQCSSFHAQCYAVTPYASGVNPHLSTSCPSSPTSPSCVPGPSIFFLLVLLAACSFCASDLDSPKSAPHES
jgi:hypothetical protein